MWTKLQISYLLGYFVKKQYVFLHKLLADTITFREDTEVGVKEFYSYQNGISR